MLKYYFIFLNLVISGLKYNTFSQKRTVFYMTRSPIFQPMMIFADFVFQQFLFLDPGLCQAGRQQLCIGKFIFACTFLAFCSLSMTPFCTILPAVVYFFPQSLVFILHSTFMYIVHTLYIFAMLFLTDQTYFTISLQLRFLRLYTYQSLLNQILA